MHKHCKLHTHSHVNNTYANSSRIHTTHKITHKAHTKRTRRRTHIQSTQCALTRHTHKAHTQCAHTMRTHNAHTQCAHTKRYTHTSSTHRPCVGIIGSIWHPISHLSSGCRACFDDFRFITLELKTPLLLLFLLVLLVLLGFLWICPHLRLVCNALNARTVVD
jgi:hypothetical protein